MASLLRQIVAGPRARHPEAGLDLCYVTDFIVVTSGPSSVWPKKAYRNPLDQLVSFLDRKHGEDWSIFEFRAEGTGYPDKEVYNRIHHFPFPDHHPPPFSLIPKVMAAMRNWIQRYDEDIQEANEQDKPKRVAVVHCKAGKGRSGTISCSYLISEEGWDKQKALAQFTDRRMRAGFGQGVSIPSQLRWVDYIDKWTNQMGKYYKDIPVEILEIHIWGLREGVTVTVEGYVESGRKIHKFHKFSRQEMTLLGAASTEQPSMSTSKKDEHVLSTPPTGTPQSSTVSLNGTANTSQDVILKPFKPIVLPSSDVNIDFERRSKAPAGLTMMTALAHVWWNAWFHGGHDGHNSGTFEIQWEAMDGIKGSSRKGTRALDRLAVVWRYREDGRETVVPEPAKGEPVPENPPANWHGEDNPEVKPSDGIDSGRSGGALLTMGATINEGASTLGKELGLKSKESEPSSASVSLASSDSLEGKPARKTTEVREAEDDSGDEGVRTYGLNGEHHIPYREEDEGRKDTATGHTMEAGVAKMAHIVSKMKPSDQKEHGTETSHGQSEAKPSIDSTDGKSSAPPA
ncbi:Telomerase protein component 1 [Knufia peltigerae]|uniref:phosphatidylinositol-3,4,5-trisphosphate 3-phosphatase n=1 Tax=Knufia peltigerae TaxID=1002370 RepID=A0AA39D1H2_9EURO|nr:Telomerase protein component 1 [Knufia peltigerae]